MGSRRPALFCKRQFEPAVIVTCVRCYLRFSLSLRDVEELMAERNLAVDHTTVCGGGFSICAGNSERLQGQLKYKGTMWFETYVRVPGRWMYLFRAVDNRGDTVDFYLSETRDRDAAKRFLQAALANPDNRPPRVFSVDGTVAMELPSASCTVRASLSRSAATDALATGTVALNPIIDT
jgi:transposase-like protein